MPEDKLTVTVPAPLCDFISDTRMREASEHLGRLAGAQIAMHRADGDGGPKPSGKTLPIRYRGKTMGNVSFSPAGQTPALERVAKTVHAITEHALDREMAVGDLADALMTSYEEMNLMYALLPSISTHVDPRKIGEVLVNETSRSLHCRRVSLLVLDETRQYYEVLASRGLPADVRDVHFPVADSISSRALWEEDLLIVNDIASRPDLAQLSRGSYRSTSFAVVRVPLIARGEALGVLTVTEREENSEFTAHDRKLLEGLSAMGASALLNCHLHAAVKKQMMSTIHALASAVDAKDRYTHDHAGRVAELCVVTARALGITDAAVLQDVQLAGLLHDIGKIGIPDSILTKPGRLTPEEFSTVQQHTKIGAHIVENVPGLERVAEAILHHHERYDGLGYPDGLAGDAIPITSALISVADVFDALTSDRPYRNSDTTESALCELARNKGTQFHPDVIDAFLAVMRDDDAIAKTSRTPVGVA